MDARPLPPENAYGHTKKLRFILGVLARERAKRGGRLRVLDFGCGNGAAVTQFLAGPGIDLHGVDIHPPSLAYARAHFAQEGTQFHEAVPADLIFDVIVYADVLEHLDAPAEIMRAHLGQLAPDGVIVAAIPNGYGPFEMEHRLERVFGLQKLTAAIGRLRRRLRGEAVPAVPVSSVGLPYNHESGHLTFFTRGSLRRTLAAAGLKMTRFGHGSLFCGPWSTPFMSGRLAGANVRVADSLPSWAVSVWYFEAQRAA